MASTKSAGVGPPFGRRGWVISNDKEVAFMKSVRLLSAAVAVLALLASAVPGYASPPPLTITALSNAPDRVSGGDVLVRITVPPGVPFSDIKVTLNDTDVTGVFVPESSGHSLIGLVTGLQDGDKNSSKRPRRMRTQGPMTS